MDFNIGDIVFLDKRGMIGWETRDYTTQLQKNKYYMVSNYNITENTININGYTIHPGHFKLYEPTEKGKIKGCNIFKKGDKVKVVLRGKIEWESEDFTVCDGLNETDTYEVKSWSIGSDDVAVVELTNEKGGLHPNHFAKV